MKRFVGIASICLVSLLSIATIADNHGKYFEISKNIEIFTNLYKEINTYYVDDVDPAKLMRTGVDAMLESLDPYTNYISESEIEGYRYITDGKYNGIGAIIKEVDGKVTITEPYQDCPAQKAGLKAGDVILSIDGQSTNNRSTDDVSNILKGFPGTEVELVINRPGENGEKKITLIRDEVVVPNVPFSGMLDEKTGYIVLTTFTRNAGDNVGKALKELKDENPQMENLIFDMRGNGGGLLTEAVNVSNVFIPKNEPIVTTKGKVVDWDRSFKTINNAVDEEIKLAILIDHNSASATEIVSGVIQDLDRGVLIGQRSYGKGLVQNTRDVGYNSKVKLTTAKYYIPSGRCIQGVNYKDGKPVNIPDAKRAVFKTRNGREVLDGGGVKPDIIVDDADMSPIMVELEKQFLIFNFVTEHVLGTTSVPNLEEIEFNDFEKFVSYVEEKGFTYTTKTEKELESLKLAASEDSYDEVIQQSIKSLEEQIASAKRSSLMQHKQTILNRIEKEIASRYYYQNGKIRVGLRNDEEIKKAISVLSSTDRYDSILKQ